MSAAVEVAEAVEEVVDTVIRVNVVKRFFSQKSTQIGTVAVVAVGLGVATGWKIAEKRLQAKYDIMLEEELEKSREHLHEKALKLDKEKEFADPEALLATVEATTKDMEAAIDVIKTDYTAMYRPQSETDPDPEEENEFLQQKPAATVEVEEHEVVVERKLIETQEYSAVQLESYEAINLQRIQEGLPHVISAEDFNENETEWEQATITWFDGDGVLVDEREQMIDDVEGIVGEVNMDRFGFLSEDNNIVYIRNPEKELELEVVHSDGSYSQDVLGLMHSDEPFERRQRRSRLGDDG